MNIHGGRKEGYRAWTHKQNFPADIVGHWQVRVLTEDGQMIGVLRFDVVDGDQPAVTSPVVKPMGLKPRDDSAPDKADAPAK
jgi:hypothetical protein